MADLSGQVKAQLLGLLDASSAVTGIVPAQRIYPMQPEALPAYPFIRYGSQNVRPYEDTCGAGVEMSVTIHAFGRSEDETQAIAAAIQSALDDAEGFAACDWIRTQIIPDSDEANIWHAVIEFSVTHTV